MPTWLIIILFGDSGRRTFRPGHVAHPDFQGTPHRLRNFHQRKHAQTGYQMRRSGDPRTDDGTRRLRIGARMLGQLRRLHPRSGSRSTRLRKKIIGDKFSANRKHGQSEFRLPVFLFSRFQPHDAERRSVRRRTLPDHHLRLRPATRHFTGATEKPRINQIRLVVTQRTIIRQRKRFAPLLRRESTPPPQYPIHTWK